MTGAAGAAGGAVQRRRTMPGSSAARSARSEPSAGGLRGRLPARGRRPRRPGDVLARLPSTIPDLEQRAILHAVRTRAPLKPVAILVIDDEAEHPRLAADDSGIRGYESSARPPARTACALIEREAAGPGVPRHQDARHGRPRGRCRRSAHLTDATPIVVISGARRRSSSDGGRGDKRARFDFIEKPLDAERVLVTVRNALDTSRLRSENRSLKRDVEKRYQMVGDSAGAAGGARRDSARRRRPTPPC